MYEDPQDRKTLLDYSSPMNAIKQMTSITPREKHQSLRLLRSYSSQLKRIPREVINFYH
jgi:hypothetical protein